MAGATRSIVINASMEKIWKVITDYERYPDFLTEVKKIRTSNRKGNEIDVQYEAEVVKTIKYTLHFKEEPPGKLTWSFIEGEFIDTVCGIPDSRCEVVMLKPLIPDGPALVGEAFEFFMHFILQKFRGHVPTCYIMVHAP